jgi:two-component system OmpR family response regulator
MSSVLIVEDVYSVRLKVELVLRNAGSFDVLSADNGVEALQIACNEQPDLIVMDIVMNGLDGLSVLRKLRSRGVTCPVVAYTARSEHSPGEYVDQGFDAYVSKSESLSTLISVLRRLINAVKRPQRIVSTQQSSVSTYPRSGNCFAAILLPS